MKTKEINQWIHILSREEASKVPEAVAVAEGVMGLIQMTGMIGGISMTTGSREISVVVEVATAGSTSASNSHSTTVKNHKSLNLKVIAVAEVAPGVEDVVVLELPQEAETTSTLSPGISNVMIIKSLAAMTDTVDVRTSMVTSSALVMMKEMVVLACVEA